MLLIFQKENNAESIFEIQYGGSCSDDNLGVVDDTHSEAFKASQGTAMSMYDTFISCRDAKYHAAG